MSEPSQSPIVDWKRWETKLVAENAGVVAWEGAVKEEIGITPAEAESWPDSIHDALAVAGKEMSRLGEERHFVTNAFAAWLVETITIDTDAFSGMTYIRGSQSNCEEMGWEAFMELLQRNRRAGGLDPSRHGPVLQRRYEATSVALRANRSRFAALDAAIDRIVWQLVGLSPDGSLPKNQKEAP
jgi:hypothetical protein